MSVTLTVSPEPETRKHHPIPHKEAETLQPKRETPKPLPVTP